MGRTGCGSASDRLNGTVTAFLKPALVDTAADGDALRESAFPNGCEGWNLYSVYRVSRTPRIISNAGQAALKKFCHFCGGVVSLATPFVSTTPKPVAANQRCSF